MASQDKNKIREIFTNLVETNEISKEKKPESTSGKDVSCNPQSKDLFLERVKTFTTTNWAAKPLELSPLHCAQYGWCSEHEDQLRCVTCNATIYAGIPDEWDASAYSEICSKIQNELQIGHEKLCPWPKNPCPPSFLSLPSYTSEQWKTEIKSAFNGLVELRSNLPELNEDEVASMRALDNSCIEELLSKVFQYSGDNDDEALQGKIACILALCGWTASMPIVEDPSITCPMCGKEAGLWNYKSLSNRHNKRNKMSSFECVGAYSQQSLADYPDVMSSSVSVKSEKSENSTHSGSMTHELSKLATSSDSLAQSDLLKPAGSQESLINLRVSDSKHMVIDSLDHQDCDSLTHEDVEGEDDVKLLFSEPKLPHATPPELMKELLLSTAPGSNRTHSIYSDSIFSEVGSECFEKRLEDTTEREIELDRAITENPPPNHPNRMQQQWMKELLFMTAESHAAETTESVMSEIGSISFDRRLDNSSILNSPRATTPVHCTSTILDDEEIEPVRTKRMRFQEPDICLFNMLDEHRHWCPWIAYSTDELDETMTERIFRQKQIAGWKTVLHILLPSSRVDAGNILSPQPVDAWKSVRTVLGECVSSSAWKT